ncbi:MAG: uroporphyrinogen decarboxylase family protein [Lentisphaeria bacterium]|nr:uroporphyrinogen decarboxylase family protein [Lentisphaeria bacterium]
MPSDTRTMTSRERVLATIEHQEPDRLPVDLGGSIMTGIMAQALARLRQHLGGDHVPTKVYEMYQMLGQVDDDIIDRFGIDVLPVEPHTGMFEIRREGYKPWQLFDGTEVLVPGQFEVETDEQGRWLLHEGGDMSRPVAGVMPKDGYYFDGVAEQPLDLDYTPPPIDELRPEYTRGVPTEELEFMAARAEALRPTDKALMLAAYNYCSPAGSGSIPNWLCVMMTEPDYVSELSAIRTEAVLRNLQDLYRAVGDNIDIVIIDSSDYGTQRAEIFSPDLFEQFYFPYYNAVIGWVHEHTPWKTWKHCCGSIPRLLPYFVESGLDCINPVQCSACGMEPEVLKEKFGDHLTFWGGGVDTQKTLPFGTPDEVYDEVAERIRVLGAGGGFVFNTVHNIQANTPPENILAMYQAVQDHW